MGACVEAVWAFRESFSGRYSAIGVHITRKTGTGGGDTVCLLHLAACGTGKRRPVTGSLDLRGSVVSHMDIESRYGMGGSLQARSESLFPPRWPSNSARTLCFCGGEQSLPSRKRRILNPRYE